MLDKMLENVRKKSPLIHNITNYVTVNDCANITIACGAAPIMADDDGEVAEITGICAGLNINIGTLNSRTIKSMLIAGKTANELKHPVVLDPVGVGVSKLRTDTAKKLLKEVKFTAIRGNISEIKTLAAVVGLTEKGSLAEKESLAEKRCLAEKGSLAEKGGFAEKGFLAPKGVDANTSDKVTEENLAAAVSFAKDFSAKTGAVIAITGAIDIVADSSKAYCIYNGHPDMSSITGTGCQLSSLTAAFVTANPDSPLEATAAAVAAMGYAGEIAHERLTPLDGNSTYRNYIIDAIYNMTPEMLAKGAKYEVR